MILCVPDIMVILWGGPRLPLRMECIDEEEFTPSGTGNSSRGEVDGAAKLDRPLQDNSDTPPQIIQNPRYGGASETRTDGAEYVYKR